MGGEEARNDIENNPFVLRRRRLPSPYGGMNGYEPAGEYRAHRYIFTKWPLVPSPLAARRSTCCLTAGDGFGRWLWLLRTSIVSVHLNRNTRQTL
jgi:hypothetical protein